MKKKLKSSRNRHAVIEFWMPYFLRYGFATHDQYEGEERQRAGWAGMDWVKGSVWVVPECTPMPIAEAWKISKREMLDEWISERPGSRPWAFWHFADPKRPEGMTEIKYLKDHNLLTRTEVALLNKGVI
jgi:hypothetical protein